MKLHAYASIIAALAIASGSFAASGTAIPGGNQATTYVINKSGSYYLAANRVMTDNTKHAIEIKATDVTLDLNGFTLSFANPDGGNGDGIRVASGENIEIRNGSITDVPAHGLYTYSNDGEGFRVFDLRLSLIGKQGIRVSGTNVLIERCSVSRVGNAGIAGNGKNVTIRNCSVFESGSLGIVAQGQCIVTGNTVYETYGSGISVSWSFVTYTGSTIEGNTVDQVNKSGYGLGGGIVANSYSIVRNNRVSVAMKNGIRASYGSVVEDNLVVGTSGTAYALDTKCVARNNTGVSYTVFASGNFVDAGGNIAN